MRTRTPSAAFLGVGWAFPLAVDATGAIATVGHEADVEQAIRIILGTNRGERAMRPEFGAGLRDFVHRPMNTATVELVRRRVRDALIDHEPRIDVETVDVTPEHAAGRLLIDVAYRIRASNSRTNLVYPFYLEEGAA